MKKSIFNLSIKKVRNNKIKKKEENNKDKVNL